MKRRDTQSVPNPIDDGSRYVRLPRREDDHGGQREVLVGRTE